LISDNLAMPLQSAVQMLEDFDDVALCDEVYPLVRARAEIRASIQMLHTKSQWRKINSNSSLSSKQAWRQFNNAKDYIWREQLHFK
jgi:hypothetical protein